MKIYVDPTELHAAADKLRQFSTDYTSVSNRLIQAATSMGEGYQSSDGDAFVRQITGFCDELKAMAEHLNLSAQALDKQARNYENVREHNLSVVKALAN